jgi:DNA-binding helix-hairpin-helix protein with protein kinase domain
LFTSAGQLVTIGKELGRGGEGTVYSISDADNLVAKIYHESLDQKKQSKLRLMAGTRDDKLLSYSAWPQDTLHSSRGGPIVGFVMAKIHDMKPIQMLYSPAHRKREYSNRGWDFLLFAARNTAAAFTVLHDRGHVLGDVNQGNAYVGNKATITLIDTDSYQIRDRDQLHLCEVGVSHYTPPELQGGSFKAARTTNHDNFGLALLIFHLLYGGRHPYAGVPQRDGVGESLESNIQQLRFAYSRTAAQRLLTPPPNSLPLSIVPPPLAEMFESAFTEKGRNGQRPTARQWLDELDRTRANLKVCAQTKMHVFSAHLQGCPWCSLETQGVSYFLSAAIYTTNPDTGGTLKIAEIWLAICQVPTPIDVKVPASTNKRPVPTPLPTGVVGGGARKLASVFICAAAIALYSNLHGPGLLYFFAVIIALTGTWKFGVSERNAEARSRSVARQTAQKEYNQALESFNRDAGTTVFQNRREHLNRLKLEFDDLVNREKKDLDTLRTHAETRQRVRYLEQFFIDKANLSGIGPANRATLASFGIETAAEVEWNRVRRLKGFGDVKTRTLVDWRKSLERNFRFNPSQSITQADINQVKQKVHARAQGIQQELRKGLTDIQNFPRQQEQAVRHHTPILQRAADRLAQANADWEALH